jgi:hypothetical protein
MTGVVLRCPNCGTTKGTLGECEACHEAQVRYYCTNHTPGRWLDGPACSQCGAAFGERPRPRAGTPATAGASQTPTAGPPTAGAPAPTARPRPAFRPTARPGAGRASTRESGRFPPWPVEDEEPLDKGIERRDERIRRPTSVQELLLDALRRRSPPPEPPPEREVLTRGPGLGGCLVRLVLLLFLALLATVGGVFVFASSWFQLFRL